MVPCIWLRIDNCQASRIFSLLNPDFTTRFTSQKMAVRIKKEQNKYENSVMDSMDKLFSFTMATIFSAPA